MKLNKKNIGFCLAVMVMMILPTVKVSAGIMDSIGVEKKDGKLFVLHRMEAKETLYSISKRYNVTVDEIKNSNPDLNVTDIKIGEIVKVPVKVTNTNSVAVQSGATHTVEAKETLYAISKKYNVSIEDLKKSNPELENGLKVGQTIIIPGKNASETQAVVNNTNGASKKHKVEAKETLYSISKQYGVTIDELKAANPELENGLKVGQEITIPGKGGVVQNTTVVVKEEKKEETKKQEKEETNTNVIVREQVPVNETKNTPSGDYKKINETGFAELIEENTDTPKFLALHKTAPVGTIIQVTNEANGQKIFVRVIGKLQNTAPGDKVVIKISRKAYERLSGVDKKIPVNLSYIL